MQRRFNLTIDYLSIEIEPVLWPPTKEGEESVISIFADVSADPVDIPLSKLRIWEFESDPELFPAKEQANRLANDLRALADRVEASVNHSTPSQPSE